MAARSTKSVLLELLSALDGRPLGLKALCRAGSLFGISDNNVRVTLARLKRDDLVATAGRGRYRLGPKAQAVAARVNTWRDAEAATKAWRGAWIGVHSVSGSTRQEARGRARALRLLGFRTLGPSFWVRPDNLRGTVATLRGRLVDLGLTPATPVFRMTCLDEATESVALGLWDTAGLEARYRSMRSALADATKALDTSGRRQEVLAREAFELGSDAIRLIVHDPMLPEPIVDTAARAAFIDAMRRFDDRGRALWTRLLTEAERDAEVHFGSP